MARRVRLKVHARLVQEADVQSSPHIHNIMLMAGRPASKHTTNTKQILQLLLQHTLLQYCKIRDERVIRDTHANTCLAETGLGETEDGLGESEIGLGF